MDLSNYIGDMKKAGFKNQSKLQGMLNKAKAIAAKRGKENDLPTIIGIFQQFFKEESNNLK